MLSPQPLPHPRNAPPPITLTTDFGLVDGYVGVMKGVILDILPWAKIIDITHKIEPQNIHQAAYVLGTISPYFPKKTVHVVVVDPGVGTERRPLAVFTRRACYVGPDNGVFSRVYHNEDIQEIRELVNSYYRRPQLSNTFHGRDLFAPMAAHIAMGVPRQSIGPVVTDPVRFAIVEPRREDDGVICGEIIYTDHFGNCISNIPSAWLEGSSHWLIRVAGHELKGFYPSYGYVKSGQPVAVGGSAGLLEVAIRDGNAARSLAISTGDQIIVQKSW